MKRDSDIEWDEDMEQNDDIDRKKQHMGMSKAQSECSKMMLAHAYVPWQCYDTAFSPQEALMKGTLFPELYGPYMPPH